jgi:UTP--glucose-1-phosphate uridylyltransferase
MSGPVRKAVIPAAGLGTRFLPASKATPKEMMPIVDKPAIQYVVEEAVRVGITDILIITGRGKRNLEDHFDRSFELEHELARTGKHDLLKQMQEIADLADIHYVRQGEARGLGHAVSVARKHVGDQPFAVMLGDDIMHESSPVLQGMIDAYEQHGGSVVALKQVTPAEISSYGCAAVEPAGELVRITDIVEKPPADEAPSNLAVMGRYVFSPTIFEILDRVEPGKGGEIQLTDALEKLAGAPEWTGGVYGVVFRGRRYDTGDRLDYLKAIVQLASDHEDLGDDFRPWLREFAQKLDS